MGFLDYLASNSDLSKSAQEREVNKVLIEKQLIENELKKREMANPSGENAIMGQLFQTGDYGRKAVEENMRKIIGVPSGPLQESQFNITQRAKETVPNFESK